MHALGLEFGSAAQLSKRPGSVWNCALKRSPGVIRKSRVSYPGSGFLSIATWPSLPKKLYNGLNQAKSYGSRGGLRIYAIMLPSISCGFSVAHYNNNNIIIISISYKASLTYGSGHFTL